jgi:predicted Zn-dependent protease
MSADRLKGSFNDGRTAARIDVTLQLEPGGLRVSDEAARDHAYWSYEGLRHLDEVFEDEPLRLYHENDRSARLTLTGGQPVETLFALAPQLRIKRRRYRPLRWTAMGLASVAVLFVVLFFALPRFAGAVSQVIPTSWEVALGEQSFEQILELFAKLADDEAEKPRFCEGPKGRAALDRLTANLAAASAAPYEFRVAVLDLPVNNAFALPGGRIVVFKGLIDFAESPDEVAGVLAHEIGHVTERHGTERIVESLGLGLFFGVMLGDFGSSAVALVGETLVNLSYSRDAETEADSVAVGLLDEAGIAGGGLASFFKRLEESGPEMHPALQLLSTHPASELRAQRTAGSAGGPAMSEADWTALQAICGG